MTDMTVANEIARQMGGTGRLKAFAGARDFVGSDDSLMFRWTAKAENRANKLRVTLGGDDLYVVEFFRMTRKGGVPTAVPVSKHEGIYNDMLVELFETETKLFLHF